MSWLRLLIGRLRGAKHAPPSVVVTDAHDFDLRHRMTTQQFKSDRVLKNVNDVIEEFHHVDQLLGHHR